MDNESLVSGLYVFAPSERSPSFVKAKLSIKPEQLIEWLKTVKPNEKGYISIDVLESKSGKWYAKKDEYTRKEGTATSMTASEEISDDSIPF